MTIHSFIHSFIQNAAKSGPLHDERGCSNDYFELAQEPEWVAAADLDQLVVSAATLALARTACDAASSHISMFPIRTARTRRRC